MFRRLLAREVCLSVFLLIVLGGCVPALTLSTLSASLLTQFDSIDVDESVGLTLPEAQAGAAGLTEATFSRLDMDGNGILTRAELEAGAGTVPGAFTATVDVPGIRLNLVGMNELADGTVRVLSTATSGHFLHLTDIGASGAEESSTVEFSGMDLSRFYTIGAAESTGDGGFLLVGRYHSNGEDGASNQVYLRKTDGAGALVWEFDTMEEAEADDVQLIPLRNGDYLLTAGTTALRLFRIAPDGSQQWRVDFESEVADEDDVRIAERTDGTIEIDTHGGPYADRLLAALTPDGTLIPESVAGVEVEPETWTTLNADGSTFVFNASVSIDGNGALVSWTFSRHVELGSALWESSGLSVTLGGIVSSDELDGVLRTIASTIFTPLLSRDGQSAFLVGTADDGPFVRKVDYATGEDRWLRRALALPPTGSVVETEDGGLIVAGDLPVILDGVTTQVIRIVKINANGDGAALQPH